MIVDKSLDTFALEVDREPLVIGGWIYGFNKVGFTKMLRQELGYSLTVAKSITDQVLASPPVELLVAKADHERISLLSVQLGAIVTSRSQPRDGRGNSCQ